MQEEASNVHGCSSIPLLCTKLTFSLQMVFFTSTTSTDNASTDDPSTTDPPTNGPSASNLTTISNSSASTGQ